MPSASESYEVGVISHTVQMRPRDIETHTKRRPVSAWNNIWPPVCQSEVYVLNHPQVIHVFKDSLYFRFTDGLYCFLLQ